jgi:hypothetical protein
MGREIWATTGGERGLFSTSLADPCSYSCLIELPASPLEVRRRQAIAKDLTSEPSEVS